MDMVGTDHVIRDEATLEALYGEQNPAALAKEVDYLHPHYRAMIEASPFMVLATVGPEGLDCSPRGDPAGEFVQVVDERTLLIPDRPGNRIADTLVNLLTDSRIALLFMIPGVGDSFRVNGRAVITDDAELLEPSTLEGKRPKLGLLVTIEQVYTQCSKAFIRSDIWNPEKHIGRDELPSSGAILRSLSTPEFDAAKYDSERAERYARREGFY